MTNLFYGAGRQQLNNTYYLAIDIGASSGRHVLGHVEDGIMKLEEVYRFENRQVMRGGHTCWDIELLKRGIIDGIRRCGMLGKIPKTIGIDTWAIDYVLLDKNDDMIGDAVAYRDRRTDGRAEKVDRMIPERELYERTGIQRQEFNTIYQLMALKNEDPGQLEQAESLLMLPDYFNFILTGVKKQEYTNATSTGLVNAERKTWDYGLIDRLGYPKKLFGELSMPGTVVGHLLPLVQETVGFDAEVVLPATHDTGSAFLAVPAKDDKAVYLSSGTWSLLGVENEDPITTPESQKANFTNEGGAWYRFRYLKNIMGLWIIQSIRRELNGVSYVAGRTSRHKSDREWSFPDLAEEAKKYSAFPSLIDVNENRFLAPSSMIDEIENACRESGQPVPENVGELMQCVYRSLADSYRRAVEELSILTGKTYTSMNIVGGGCQDKYLNEMTEKATGLPVSAGPVEGTAIGNLIVQMIHGGEYKNLADARASVARSF